MEGLISGAKENVESHRVVDPPFLVVDNFLPLDLARSIRREIETYFTMPNLQNAEVQQVWNYRFVAGLCAYFRTSPGRVVRQANVKHLSDALQGRARDALGLWTMSWPVLNFYLPGCYQKLHSDPVNGRIGYVYSVTSDSRETRGGQTLIFNDGDPVRVNFQAAESSGNSFCTSIEPAFNRLILFDTRAPHAVEQLTGGAAPLEGRFDFQGYFSESVPIVDGPLPPEEALAIVGDAVNEAFSDTSDFMSHFNGPLCLRLDIDETGAVREVRPLLHRVLPVSPGGMDFSSLLGALLTEIGKRRFPAAAGPTRIILPVMFGGFLPFLDGGVA